MYISFRHAGTLYVSEIQQEKLVGAKTEYMLGLHPNVMYFSAKNETEMRDIAYNFGFKEVIFNFIDIENYYLLKSLSKLIKDRLPPQGEFSHEEFNNYYHEFRTVEGIENVGKVGDVCDYLPLIDPDRFYYDSEGYLMDKRYGVYARAESGESLHGELGSMLFHAIFTFESSWEKEVWATGIYINRTDSRFRIAEKIDLILSKVNYPQ